jgi:hypothetical protein
VCSRTSSAAGFGPASRVGPAPPATGRRRLLQAALTLAAALLTPAHTPFRQWVVYRQKNLHLGTSRSDAGGFDVGERLAQALETTLPESRATVARAADLRRLASLLATAQIEVVVLSPGDAAKAAEGRGEFGESGPVPLGVLFEAEGYLLLARLDFPDAFAYEVARALDGARPPVGQLPAPAEPGRAHVPHPGVLAFLSGEPAPPPPPAMTPEDDHPHPEESLSRR